MDHPNNGRKSNRKIPPKKLVTNTTVDDDELLNTISQLENSLLGKDDITEKSVQASAVHFGDHSRNDDMIIMHVQKFCNRISGFIHLCVEIERDNDHISGLPELRFNTLKKID